MVTATHTNKRSTARFIASVAWGFNRAVVIYRRRHKGRDYVNLRIWNRHTCYGYWYPSKRYFVIPVDDADSLADAIRAAGRGEVQGSEPDWSRQAEERYVEYKRRLREQPDAQEEQPVDVFA